MVGMSITSPDAQDVVAAVFDLGARDVLEAGELVVPGLEPAQIADLGATAASSRPTSAWECPKGTA
jgi:hypothetical protein